MAYDSSGIGSDGICISPDPIEWEAETLNRDQPRRTQTCAGLASTQITSCSFPITGIRYLPEEAIHFTKCSPTSDECPKDSSCVETKRGYYCACDNDFYNDRDWLTITYPGGQCSDKCTDDEDCPGGASCQNQVCYCPPQQCDSKYLPACVRKIRLNGKCTAGGWRFGSLEAVFSGYISGRGTHPWCGCPPVVGRSDWYDRPEQQYNATNANDTKCGDQYNNSNNTQYTLENLHRPDATNVTASRESRVILLLCSAVEVYESQNICQVEQLTYYNVKAIMSLLLQDAFCTLLRENARIQEQSCQTNETNISVEQVAQKFTNVLNHVTLTNLTTSERRSAVTSIVTSVENSLLEMFSKDLQNQNISTPELEVQTKVSRDVCGTGAPSITLTVLDNIMSVPCTHVTRDTDGAILISYKGLETLGENDQEDTEEIISPIISGAITSPNIEILEPPVAFYLKQLKVVPPSFIVRCVFWDTEERVWSSRGCETKMADRENSTLCICNHLSTFAVLMALSDIQEDGGLILISRIGLSVSLVCLCLSLLTFTMCRSIRSAHTSVLTALCLCLFIGQILVLFGLHQTGNKVLCAVIAGLLQFSFLCAFCWMSLESALLFMTVRNLQAMNYLTSKRSHFPYMGIAGFGIPLIIIIVSAAMRPDGYGTEKYCWLHLDLIWSFLGPVCVFITTNFTLLVLTFALLKKKMASLNSNVSTIKHTRLLTFKALSQLFILGCTWIIGIFQFGSGALVMSYIFTICNSLQGLYIFCVHCLLNRQVWKEYMMGFHRFHSKKSESETMSSNTAPTALKLSSDIQGFVPALHIGLYLDYWNLPVWIGRLGHVLHLHHLQQSPGIVHLLCALPAQPPGHVILDYHVS
ncbi:PREDICTED: adhesion G protein-coupled receptor E3-like [Nanorana parkeri]|uniref:adhesion G protein-coupled receptor E3-like n=1 Tax=Nanorana parkeri TaxID=125878 RepID=UPI0008540AA2|nr:PREDICTED: adhesion G protein-coupled receptor E3-like [Nanorana parkeri]